MASPSWTAVITHTPAVIVVTEEPDTVHTAGVLEVNDTASPDDADDDKVTGTPTFVSCG